MTLREEQNKFARDVNKLLAWAFEMGYEVSFGEAFRTPEQQDIYVKTGRSKTYNSKHLKRCAIDLHFFKGGELCYPEAAGRTWQELDSKNEAGMFWKSFQDSPHFQRNV